MTAPRPDGSVVGYDGLLEEHVNERNQIWLAVEIQVVCKKPLEFASATQCGVWLFGRKAERENQQANHGEHREAQQLE